MRQLRLRLRRARYLYTCNVCGVRARWVESTRQNRPVLSCGDAQRMTGQWKATIRYYLTRAKGE